MTALCDRVIARLALGPQQLGQRQAPQGQPADLEEVAPGHSVAVSRPCTSCDREHPVTPLWTSHFAVDCCNTLVKQSDERGFVRRKPAGPTVQDLHYIYASAVRPAVFGLEKWNDVFRFGATLPDIINCGKCGIFAFTLLTGATSHELANGPWCPVRRLVAQTGFLIDPIRPVGLEVLEGRDLARRPGDLELVGMVELCPGRRSGDARRTRGSSWTGRAGGGRRCRRLLSSTLAPMASRLEVLPLPVSSRRSQWFLLPPSLRKRRAGPLLTVTTTSRSPSPSISA